MNIIPRKHLELNLIIAIAVFCLPFLLYAYLLFPEVKVLNFWIFRWETIGYNKISILMYQFFLQFYVLCFLSVWFLSIKATWRYVILLNIIYFWYRTVLGVSIEFSIRSNIHEISILVGVIYCLFLYFLNGKIKLFSIQNISPESYDIIRILTQSIKEKNIFSNKQNFKKNKNTDGNSKYTSLIKRIKHLEILLDNSNKIPFFHGSVKLRKKNDLFIWVMLLITPFLLILFNFFPSDSKTIDIYIIHYKTNFPSSRIFAYYFLNKVYNLLLLSVWFFTTKNILKYGIFFNIIIAVFQMAQALDNTESKVDEGELITALPIMIPILLTFLLLHRVIKYKSKNDILNEEIEEEIQKVLTTINAMEQDENNLVAELISLRENQAKLSKATYQEELLRIKGAIERKIASE
ncbi:hypothetical protein [Cellulophaga baltica]|uniref:hypothetical protein n=1 Tax=Cellulophaga baltica TaxID=76594 RepID=UPI00040F4DBF|nr:hypothetical protein [Cellulophaga baltica]AIY14768.1 hypothetical protein M667_17220 [Cellulophaga baltica NN016038]